MKKTKTGYSTDAEVLEKLAPYHEIVANIVHYRQLTKLQSTYVEGLLKEIREETGKMHTYYRQTIAATGAEQPISEPAKHPDPAGRRTTHSSRLSCLPRPGGSFWPQTIRRSSCAYWRIFPRMNSLMEAFHEDMDIHTKTAMDVFGVSADEVDANMRRQAKAVNFGIVYGISDYGLSQNLHITRKEAAAFIEQYFNVFKGVRKFMDDIVAKAKRDGYVSTLSPPQTLSCRKLTLRTLTAVFRGTNRYEYADSRNSRGYY